ncbi:hypothetical protein [uncultured Sphingomonas sp.]|uniref:hypothetical protein n=1 Tax=uncultured Sphingomonas sp. TaxID=158754 RepID=UPI0025EC99F7|nr:hypothetical protein [uncultured Sphingomonas sp.]
MTLGLLLALAAQSSTAATPAKPPVDPATADKQICRRIVETGSFVKAKKLCMTREEWARQREASRDLAQRAVSDGSGRAGGN